MLVRTLSYYYEIYIKLPHSLLDYHNTLYTYYRSTKCEYLDGSCLASPRWVSLLVAEIYYPDVSFPNPAPSQNRNPVKGASPPNVCSVYYLLLSFYWSNEYVECNRVLNRNSIFLLGLQPAVFKASRWSFVERSNKLRFGPEITAKNSSQ